MRPNLILLVALLIVSAGILAAGCTSPTETGTPTATETVTTPTETGTPVATETLPATVTTAAGGRPGY